MLLAAIFSVALLISGASAEDTQQQQQQQQVNNNDDKTSAIGTQLVQSPSSINLAAIVEHQEALERECAKYHEEKLQQLEHLVKYQDQNKLQLPRPLHVKVPAVCLFLFSQFRRTEPMKSGNTKLELVNWIYNEDQIRDLHNGDISNNSSRVVKREAEQQNDNANSLLNDYILDPAADYSALNGLEPDEMKRLHHDVDSMLESEGYKQMVENNRNRLASHLSPVILVPGLLGSRMQARVDKQKRVNIFCKKQNDWQDMWLSLRQLLPLLVDCWLDNVILDHDETTGFTKAPAGVETRVPDFGSVESVRSLDLRSPELTEYFAPIIERYEQLGYTADVNLHAAPYDFRLAPQEMAGYFADLKRLVERAQSQAANDKKVTLVCHSMGCTHLLVFLRQQTPEWRQARVRKMIALSAPWGGAVKALKALVVGDQLELPLVTEAKMRRLSRTFPSVASLLPQAEVFAKPNKLRAEPGGPVMVQTPERSYRAADLPQLLGDLDLDRQAKWFEQTSALIKPYEPLPDVQVDCIHCLNTPTPETLVFRNQSAFPDGPYELVFGDGDGTVNYESLMVCDDWAKRLPGKVRHRIVTNTTHVGVIGHKATLTFLTDDVLIRG